MKKRFRKQFDKLESRFNRDLDRIHSLILYKFRTTNVNMSIGGHGGGGVFAVPKATSYVIVSWGGSGGGGGDCMYTKANNPAVVDASYFGNNKEIFWK